MPEISIIIPVYSVEQYLEKCLNSVILQTFTGFECILVDDGSPDNCGAICDEYAKKDARIKVIHKKNGGVSSARNAGLDIAQGEWIGFVDSDDWCDPEMFQILYNNAVKHDVDISICGVKRVSHNGSILRYADECINSVMLTSKEAILLMFDIKSSIGGFSFNKLLKKQIIKKNNLRYDEAVSYMEDVQFFYTVFKSADRVYYSSKPRYFYRQTNMSVTNQIGFTPAATTAMVVLDELYEKEQDFAIRQKILLNRVHFMYKIGVKCVLKNKKDKEFKTNMQNLKKYVWDKRALLSTFRCKMFVLIHLPFLIFPYVRIKKLCMRNVIK